MFKGRRNGRNKTWPPGPTLEREKSARSLRWKGSTVTFKRQGSGELGEQGRRQKEGEGQKTAF